MLRQPKSCHIERVGLLAKKKKKKAVIQHSGHNPSDVLDLIPTSDFPIPIGLSHVVCTLPTPDSIQAWSLITKSQLSVCYVKDSLVELWFPYACIN